MKKLLFLGIFIASQIFAAQETITTYLDSNFTIPISEFEDESMVYVTAVGTQTGGFINGTVTASSGSIRLYFEDEDSDGTYTAYFTISKTSTNIDWMILRLLPNEIGTITIDLDNDGNIGSATIKAIGRETIRTFNQYGMATPNFSDDSTVYVTATTGYKIGTPSIKGTVTGPSGNIKLRFTDFDNDGTYTASFKIDKDGINTDFSLIKLLPEESAIIEVDLNNDKRIGSATIRAIKYETIITYYDQRYKNEGSHFKDGANVYLTSWISGNINGGNIDGTATSYSPFGSIPIRFSDPDFDGTYTARFTISKTQDNKAYENLKIDFSNTQAKIMVDLDKDGFYGTKNITTDYDLPYCELTASDNICSLNYPVTITVKSTEDGSYIITAGTTTIKSGEKIYANQGTSSIWNGTYWDEEKMTWSVFSDGTSTLNLSVSDNAGNLATATKVITIDNTAPSITVYPPSPLFFSPGTSSDSKDSTYIRFFSSEPGSFTITIDGTIPSGIYSGVLNYGYEKYYGSYLWDGSYTTQPASEGIHTIKVEITDLAGNTSFKETEVTIDRIWPYILSLTENTGGEVFYRDEVIQFTMKARDFRGDVGTITADNGDEAKVSFGGRNVSLSYFGEGISEEGSIYQGYYTVQQQDLGTLTISGFFKDKAGNPAINYGTQTGVITLDGSMKRPTQDALVGRIGLLPPKEERPKLSKMTISSSTTETMILMWEKEDLQEGRKVKIVDKEKKHIWVGVVINKNEVSINNGLLYYGKPIQDYKNVVLESAYLLKDVSKAGDYLIFSLEGFKIIGDEIIPTSITKGSTSITIYDSRIKKDESIFVSSLSRIWIGNGENGSFTISNSNLYSGEILSDYSNISIDRVAKVSPATGGNARIDIGSVRPNIPLSDDGIDGIGILSGDIVPSDGIYSGVYTIKEGDDTNDAPIIGNFIYNRKPAKNSPYSDSRIILTIDATPPLITNYTISPSLFNPFLKSLPNAVIKYNLSEKAYVTINITDKADNTIRILESPDAQFGENLKMFWDGKNSGGNIVNDALYYYIISAEDLARNKAIEKKGEIRVTSVEIKTKDLIILPNPFWPNKDAPDTIDVEIKFKVVLENSKGGPVTDEQLKNLNFDFYQGWNYINAPYALLTLEVYDQNMKKVNLVGYPDLSAGHDMDDYNLYGYHRHPYYYDGKHSFNYSVGDKDKKDKGDGDKGNDYDILVPFYKDRNGNYYQNFSYGWIDWDGAKGTYIIRTGAELVSIVWKWLHDPEKDLEEKWHAQPYYGHFGLKQEKFLDGRVTAVPPEEPQKSDIIPPSIKKTNPAGGEEFEFGTITEVWAELEDISGIDFKKSEIFLFDLTGEKISGKKDNNGINKIYWKLDNPLTMNNPGVYTIKINAFDIPENGTKTEYTFAIKDIISPRVADPYPTGIVNTPFLGPVYIYISEDKGESGINKDKTTMYLGTDTKSDILTERRYIKTGETTEKLIGELLEIKDDGMSDGTYTIYGRAYDNASNYKNYFFSFYLKTIFPEVKNPYPQGTIDTPYNGNISIFVEEDKKGSEIDWDRSKIWLIKPENKGTLSLNIKSEGALTHSGTITGSLPQALTYDIAGIWTIMFEVYDKTNHLLASFNPPSPMFEPYKRYTPSFSFYLNPVCPIISLPYPSGLRRAPYDGTISVNVNTNPSKPEIDLDKCSLSLSGPKGHIAVTTPTTYIGGASSGILIATPTTTLVDEGTYVITAIAYDKAGNMKVEYFYFSLEWEKPIVSVSLSPSSFSPYTKDGEYDTTTVSFSATESGTYTISISGRIINTGSYLLVGSITLYIWNGYDAQGGTFTDGTYNISVSVKNPAEKTGTETSLITIDNKPSEISLSLSDYIISPGTSTGIQDTSTITFSFTEDSSYIIRVDGGSVSSGFLDAGNLCQFIWNPGVNVSSGSHTIQIEAKDAAGNKATKTTSIFIDNTPPSIKNIKDNTGKKKFYLDEVIIFTLETEDDDVEYAYCIFGTKTISLEPIEKKIFRGSYKVEKGVFGDWDYRGIISDFAGNLGINNNTIMGSATVDGKINPITTSRIARLGIIPEKKETRNLSAMIITGSTTDTLSVKWQNEGGLTEGQRIEIISGDYIWVTTLKNQGATISNAELYYGSPITDYKSIVPQTSYSLKTTLKADDKLIISLTAVKVENTISNFIIATKTTTSLTITGSITAGGLILVSDNIHTWLSKANQNGTFTISNLNLYSGFLVSNYTNLPGFTVEEVTEATGGNAAADLGVYLQGISLFDNGVSSFFDKIPGDGIYTGFYGIKEGDNISSVPIYGYFTYNKQKAKNDGYTDSRLTIDIDGVKPVISNFIATPSPFNPSEKNTYIKYYLSEDAAVSINIYKDNEIIRTIVPSNPKSGENVSSFWDGMDNVGVYVSDGFYSYTIDAKDKAGNKANQESGEIIVSYVKIKIKDLIISPQPFLPGDESALLVKFKAVLEDSNGGIPTDSQLNILGFDFKAKPADLNFPYSLLKLQLFDKNRKEIGLENYPDMSSNRDIDPWLWGMPNYGGYDVGSLGVISGDGDTGNDYGNLVPFFRDMQGKYYYNYEFAIKNWTNPAGIYIFQVSGELVSIYWEEASQGSNKWHAKPYQRGHYGLTSNPVSLQFEIIETPLPPPPDTTPPSLSATYPVSGASCNPYEVSYVWARLEDNSGGVGVDFDKSTIKLLDSNNQEKGGSKTTSGIDNKIFWNLSSVLTTPGNYTIKVYMVDKNANGATSLITFSVKDTLAPTISDPYPTGTVTAPFYGPITVNLSEVGRGESGINWGNSTISLKKDGIDILLTKSYTETGSNTGQLKGNLISPLTQSGTYTIYVTAYDKANNGITTTFYFSIPKEIEVKIGDDIYLDIPYGTEIIPPSKNISIGTNTVSVILLPDTLDHKEYKLIGSLTKFYYNNGTTPLYKCTFSKDVILTLHYKDEQIPSGVVETSLAIYGNGSGWTKLGGNVSTIANKITLTILAGTSIKNMYGIMYDENDPPVIGTPCMPSVVLVDVEIPITVTITDSGIGLDTANIMLSYIPVGLTTVTTIKMEPKGTNTFTCKISKDTNKKKGGLKYVITATDKNGNVGRSGTYTINITTTEETNIEKSVYTIPNPAKGSTKFRLYLLENANVKIELYAITGELVWDYKGNLLAGEQFIPYECKNKDGAKLGTGLYIYKITIEYPTKKETTIKKMVIIKQ